MPNGSDAVQFDPEVAQLRAVSFAAWRALRPPYGNAAPEDVHWAFSTRSTAARLDRARTLLRARLDDLEAAEEGGAAAK